MSIFFHPCVGCIINSLVLLSRTPMNMNTFNIHTPPPPFICWWTVELFPDFGLYKESCSKYLGTYAFISLGKIYEKGMAAL